MSGIVGIILMLGIVVVLIKVLMNISELLREKTAIELRFSKLEADVNANLQLTRYLFERVGIQSSA